MPTFRLPVYIKSPQAGLCQNVWHFRTVDEAVVGDEQVNGAVTALKAFYGNGIFTQWMPSGTTVSADFAINVATDQEKAVNWAPIPMLGTGSVAPPHLAMCVNLKTGTRGRRARGRAFLGPWTSKCIDGDGTILGDVLSGMNSALTTLINASKTDNGWAFGVYGLQDPAPQGYVGRNSDLPHVLRDYLGYSIADKWAVMRSRRP